MTSILSIRPSKDLRTNYSQISALAKQNPVAITVNGKEDTVILSHDAYVEQQLYVERLEARLKLYMHLLQAIDDIKLGRVQDMDDAINEVLLELDGLEL